VFVVAMKEILDQFDDIKIGNIDGEGAHRVLLIMFVMTLHSVSEGVGIGVSFGMADPSLLHALSSHFFFRRSSWNSVRKVYLVVISNAQYSRRISCGVGLNFKRNLKTSNRFTNSDLNHFLPSPVTALWSIFTSLPQPFMAIPAYIFVEHFKPLLPAGLGFAAGAMIFVAFFELFQEAKQEIGRLKTFIVGVISFGLMIFAQEYVRTTMY
jgi:zinc transporter, ZIP family